MVNIKDVRASNLAFKESKFNSGLVAVFVGATSGIGMGTLKQFAQYANAPKVYILGRSKAAASTLVDEVKTSNPKGTFEFIETEVSLIKNVDHACEVIRSKEKKVDILFMTPGALNLDGRNETIEGIDIAQALRYYSRLRFAYKLLPLLTASASPRVISIFGGGKEKAIDLNDLEVRKDFTAMKASTYGTTQTTLAFEELAKSNPSITFIHKFPGFVNTGAIARFMATASGLYVIPATIVRYSILPAVNLLATTVEEAGERGVFLATSARYPPSIPSSDLVGVELPVGMEVAKSSVVDGAQRNGVYRLGASDESAPDEDVLPSYRRDGACEKVWESTLGVWERALQQ